MYGAMKPLAALLLAGLAADSSWIRTSSDPMKFTLVRTFRAPAASTLSPAGNALGVFDGARITIVDVRTGRKRGDLAGHDGRIHDSGWSPDGRLLATAGYDGTVRVWDVRALRQVLSVSPHSGFACSVAISPDGRLLATGGSEDGRVKLFRIDGGVELRAFAGAAGAAYAVGFTGRGRFLVASTGDNSVRAWDTVSGIEAPAPLCTDGFVHAYAFSPDGTRVAYGVEEAGVRIVRAGTWERERQVGGHAGGIVSLSFHRGGRHLASSGRDGSVRLSDLKTGAMKQLLGRGVGRNPRVAFTRDGSSLVVTANDGTVRVYGSPR